MTSYGFKKDAASGLAVMAKWTVGLAMLVLLVAPFVAMYYMVKGLCWLVVSGWGAWLCRVAWWVLRHPVQAARWSRDRLATAMRQALTR